MKKHINLLHKNKEYQAREKRFYYLRRGTFFFGIFMVSSIAILFFLKNDQQIKYTALLDIKERYLRELVANKDEQEKVLYANERVEFIKNTVEKDSNFAPYYILLKQALFDRIDTSSTQSATIEDMHFDKKHSIEFKVNLYNDQSLTAFLSGLESEPVLNLFQSVELTKFNSIGTNHYYEATIKGVFKPLKNDLF